jgi:hypothetical protein
MKCIHISINGAHYCTAGHESVADIGVQITYAPEQEVGILSVIGVFPKNIFVERPNDPWRQKEISMDDQVVVTLVDSDKPDLTTLVKVIESASEYGSGDLGLHCSFCGKKEGEVSKIIAGPNVFICSECIKQCESILST